MELGPREIHDKQFHDEWRGYNREEVDDFLDRAAEALDQAQRSSQSLTERVRQLEADLAQAREGEQMLKKTLVTAQQHAEEAVASARAKATKIVAEAGERGRALMDEARTKAGTIESEARRRAQESERSGEQRKRELESAIERLRILETDTKQKLKAFLDAQQRSLTSLSERRASPGGAMPAGGRAPGQAGPPKEQRRSTEDSTPPWRQSAPQQDRPAGSPAQPPDQPQESRPTATGPLAPERLSGTDAAGPLLDRPAPEEVSEQPRSTTEPPGDPDGDEEANAARRTLRSLFGRDEE